MSDEIFARARRLIGLEAVVELVGLLSYYAFAAMTLNAFEMAQESDEPSNA